MLGSVPRDNPQGETLLLIFQRVNGGGSIETSQGAGAIWLRHRTIQ